MPLQQADFLRRVAHRGFSSDCQVFAPEMLEKGGGEEKSEELLVGF